MGSMGSFELCSSVIETKKNQLMYPGSKCAMYIHSETCTVQVILLILVPSQNAPRHTPSHHNGLLET